MNILIIGLGSMGKRRLRLLTENYAGAIICGVDKSEERRCFCEKEYAIRTYSDIYVAIRDHPFDFAFVCAPPLSHSGIIRICLENSMNVFTEINLVNDGYHENQYLAEKSGKTLFLSSTFLYRDEIRFMVDKIKKSNAMLNYTYHVGQYLPDWHPWENFNDFFVGNKRSNGCRELFAVELPWILRAFGPVRNLEVKMRNATSLQLDYPDTYFVTMEHESGHVGQLLVDIAARVPIRHFEVFGEDLQLEWRGKPEALYQATANYSEMEQVDLQTETSRIKGYRDFIVESAYLEEIKAFFSVCSGESAPVYTFTDDLKTLDLIDRIER